MPQDQYQQETHPSTAEERKEVSNSTHHEEGLNDTPARQKDTVCFSVSLSTLLYRYLFLVLLTAIGGFLLYILVPMTLKSHSNLILFLLILWGLGLIWYWISLLSMPYRICLEPGGSLMLASLLRQRKVDCKEITQFRVSPFHPSYLKIVTSRKRSYSIFNHIDGLHDLINRIKQINPALKTTGC